MNAVAVPEAVATGNFTMKIIRFANFIISLVVLITSISATAFAQCAMCKANIAGAENSAEVSSTINAAVLVMLIPTLAIIGGIIRLVFKYRHLSGNSYVNLRPSDTQRNPE